MTQDKNQGPIQSLGGDVKIKIWEGKGEYGSFPKMTFAKPYRDAEGRLQDGQSFTATDALKLQRLLPQALNEMDRWKEYFKEQQKAAPENVQPDQAPEASQPTLLDQRDLVMGNAAPEAQVPQQSPERTR